MSSPSFWRSLGVTAATSFDGNQIALVGLSPTRTLHPFRGNFRVGGNPFGTREVVVRTLDSCLSH